MKKNDVLLESDVDYPLLHTGNQYHWVVRYTLYVRMNL